MGENLVDKFSEEIDNEIKAFKGKFKTWTALTKYIKKKIQG